MESNWPGVLFTDKFQRKIRQTRVLLVGAGGIGSEVLKTLVLTGFRKITIIDMDTIEISNLNRQFLFRSVHVGQSKAKVAAEAVKEFLPLKLTDSSFSPVPPAQKKQKLQEGQCSSHWQEGLEDQLQIIPYHSNIKDSRFNVDFFKSFEIVLNGLDNLDARRHVNRLSFAAEVPLIESGTAGYDGNVTIHIKGRSHCYECEEKPMPKSFPICTIRNTPDKMIHCVVWAKDLLFTRCFGAADQTTDLDEEVMRNEEHEEIKGSFFLKTSEESPLDYAIRIFQRVFAQDICNVLKIEKLWTKRRPPIPINWSFEYIYPDPLNTANIDIHKVLTLQENVALFLTSVCTIFDSKQDEVGDYHFDKDDELAMAFVTSASNLRATCYGIPTTSLFEIKGMAGNIIHAIATTNAIVGGMIVNECCKVLSGCHRFLKESFVGRHTTWGLQTRKRDMLIKSTMPLPQNPNCVVCGKSTLYLSINTKMTTLDTFISKVIKGALGVSEPNLCSDGFVYEEGEGLDEDELEDYQAMLVNVLVDLPGGGIHDGSIITLDSQSQHLHCKIIISHKEDFDDEKNPDGFVLTGTLEEDSKDRERQGVEVSKRERDEDQTNASDEVLVLSDDDGIDGEEEIIAFSPKKQRLE